jgi:hypothetical protein
LEQEIIIKRAKEFGLLFASQTILYCLICINIRAVAHADYCTLSVSDFFVAFVSFFVIKKIAQSTDATYQWAGYVTGSVCGSLLGTYISTKL